jgi:glycogen debranching enzyme
VRAAASFAELARLTHHDSLEAAASAASTRARNAIRPSYFDSAHGTWTSGHLRSGAPVEGLTSSLTALLHEGMLSDAEQRTVLDALASPPFRAPWGIRSTPSDSPFYDPDSYARGSVWAIGTTDAATAFYESHRSMVGTALWRDLVPWFALDGPGSMHEVLRGDVFAPERESVPDQTWSASAFLSSAIRGLLGMSVDASKRELTFAPSLPTEWDSVRIRRIDVGGADVALTMRTSPTAFELMVDNSGPPITVTFKPSLTSEQARIQCPARQTTRISLRRSR